MNVEIKTRKDYDFFECSSALQKSIRRGNELDVLFFGGELYCSGYGGYLWKRLMIIASEDIGLADNMIPVQINALYNNWQVIKNKSYDEGIIPTTHALMILARSKKSRIVDNAKMFAMKNNYNPDVPDYALDVHTRRGKMKGRSYDFFIDTASKIENEKELETPHVTEFYKDFFCKYLKDYQNKTVTATGYDKRNVVHKTPKEMDKWKKEAAQTSINFANFPSKK